MQSPEFIAEFNACFEVSLTCVPDFSSNDPIGRRASDYALSLISQHQEMYTVSRKILFCIVDTSKFTYAKRWAAYAMWPDCTVEDWVIVNSEFVVAAFSHGDALARTLIRIDRAQAQPSVEIAAGLARSESCAQTFLSFLVCHELAHHGYGHQLLHKPVKTIGQRVERSTEFAADIYGFRCAALRSLALTDNDGGFCDPEGQILALRNAAAYMASILPLLTVLRSRHSLREVNETDHPYFGYRALLAHQIWVNEAKIIAPYMDFVDLDEIFIEMLKHVCSVYLSSGHPSYFDALMQQISQHNGTSNRLMQPVGYMTALYGVPPNWIHDMRKLHDLAVPSPNLYARGAYFQNHPYDHIM
jgi:hypothetical protein